MGDRLISSANRRGQGLGSESNANGASVSYDSEESETDVPLEENLSAMSLEEPPSQSGGVVAVPGEDSEGAWSEEASSRQQPLRSQPAGTVTSKEGRQRREAKASPKDKTQAKRKDRRQTREGGAVGLFTEEPDRYERPLQFVSQRELGHQTRIERDPHHGQFQSTVHRCHKPLHDMKIRVQLLQYASGVQKQEDASMPHDERLAVLEERIFSWQEKVFSEAESHFYHDKKNLSTELDFAYHERLKTHPEAVGNFLYSNVHSDKGFVSKKAEQRVTVRRCPAIHVGHNVTDASRSGVKQAGVGWRDSDSDSDFEEVQDRGGILAPRKGLSIFGQGRTAQARARGGKARPARHAPPPPAAGKQKDKSRSRRPTEGDGDAAAGGDGEEGRNSPGHSEEPDSDSGEDEDRRKTDRVKKRQQAGVVGSVVKASARHSLKFFDSPSAWNPDKCESVLSRAGRPQQVMYIMASLPVQNKKRRKVVVGSIRAYPRAGVILIKPSFGYRNIEPTPSHRYRLCWELLPPPSAAVGRNLRDENALAQRAGDFYTHRFGRFDNRRVLTKADDQRAQRQTSFADQIGDVFESVPSNEFRVQVMGEVVSGAGFENSPLTIHYYLELPKGWKNEGEPGSLSGVTHSSYVNANGVAHFSQAFCFQLAFSMDSVEESETYPTPALYLMATCIEPKVIVNYEGYAHVPIPSQPGFHSINVRTWKPKPVSVVERLEDSFVNITPGLTGAHAVHGHALDNECRRLNRLGLQTISSGSIQLRIHVLHHSASLHSDQRERLQLLEKMGSATILKSVQTVIEAFQRARQKASTVTTTNTLM